MAFAPALSEDPDLGADSCDEDGSKGAEGSKTSRAKRALSRAASSTASASASEQQPAEAAAVPASTSEGGAEKPVEATSEVEPLPAEALETQEERRKKRRRGKDTAEDQLARREIMPKGMEEEERLESDVDRSEESSLSEVEEYFDLVKKYTTKKTLPAVDHAKVDYKPKVLQKNLYTQVKEITAMKDHEIDDLRKTNGDIQVKGKHAPRPIKSFLQCGLVEKIVKILQRRDYEQPFPIQMQAIPALMCGRDIIAVAQTGSGKTLAYILPMLRHVLAQLAQEPMKDGDGPIGFIVAPTRELALQIYRELQVFCKVVACRTVCAIGGAPSGTQMSQLKQGCEILVGTPGRLIDVLTASNGKITNLRRVSFLVLDEADRMFDMGFEPQIGMFLQSTRPDKQVAMFSATLPTHVEALARQVLKKPLQISVGERNTAATNVKQFVEVLDETQKFYRLLQLLGEWQEHGAHIIFVGQQRDVDELFTELLKYGYPSLALHGGQDHEDRDFTLQDFKDGVANTLVATSVAARGIDVKNVILVINFKAPDHLEDYIHRIGRTGRAGKTGFAFTFITPEEGDKAQDLIDALRQCGQDVPEKLRKLAEEFQSQVNLGQASKRRRWSGYSGKSYKYDNTEKSRQQKERQRAKKDALIGDLDEVMEEDVFKDPWNEPDKPKAGQDQNKDAGQASNSAMTTAQLAAQTAERLLKAEGAVAPKAAPAVQAGSSPAPQPPPPPQQVSDDVVVVLDKKNGHAPPPPPAVPAGEIPQEKPKAAPRGPAAGRKSEQEIDAEAQRKAEETLKNASEEQRAKKLPALKEKLKERLRKEEEEKVAAPPKATPPPPPKPVEQPKPEIKALSSVQGASVPVPIGNNTSLVTKSIEQIQLAMARAPAVASSISEAERLADVTSGMALAGLNGKHMDEFEINDYPQIARQKISHREPLDHIKEMTGATCQVKGQHFTDPRKMPPGARKLYVEIVGEDKLSVQKARTEVKKMMEALAIRTLSIPGQTNRSLGAPGRYDPRVGK